MAMAGVSTHVLDTASGRPATGMRIEFSVFRDGAWQPLKRLVANADGRTDELLLAPADMRPGEYRIVFHVAEYFRARGVPLADPPFLDRVPVRFGVADIAAHYHVPLLCTPWSYSTYRGS
jgi:5-hydroxyisourate hydrolase